MSDFDIKQRICDACTNHEFVGIICDDGHEHTVKSFNNICGTPFFDNGDDLTSQLNYCEKIAKGFDVDILTADSFEEAIENDIIDEDGFIK